MPKARIKVRENRKKEAALNMVNEYGIKDPTPYKAVIIIRKERERK